MQGIHNGVQSAQAILGTLFLTALWRAQAKQSDFTRGLHATWYGRALLVILGIAFTAAFLVQLQAVTTRKFHCEIKPQVRRRS